MKRVLNFGVVAASAFIMANAKVDAAVIDISEGSTSGYTMTDGNTYVIQNSVTFSNATGQKPPRANDLEEKPSQHVRRDQLCRQSPPCSRHLLSECAYVP